MSTCGKPSTVKLEIARGKYFFYSWSSHRRCSVRICVFSNVAKFTEKHLCQSLFFNKIGGWGLQNPSGRLLLFSILFSVIFHRDFFLDYQILITYETWIISFHKNSKKSIELATFQVFTFLKINRALSVCKAVFCSLPFFSSSEKHHN